MLHSEAFNKTHLVPMLYQAKAQFDIFDRRRGVPNCVKPSNGLKNLLANGPASRPKRYRFRPGRLMHVVVEQILK